MDYEIGLKRLGVILIYNMVWS